jgi:hypothetical protein
MLDVAEWWRIVRAAGIAGVLGAAGSLVLGTSALASDRMLACGGGAVMVGAAEDEVRSKCGEPTSRKGSGSRGGGSSSKRGGGASKRGGGGSNRGGGGSKRGGGGETWVYDLGPSQLVRYLSFKGGRLERIDVGGYGH